MAAGGYKSCSVLLMGAISRLYTACKPGSPAKKEGPRASIGLIRETATPEHLDTPLKHQSHPRPPVCPGLPLHRRLRNSLHLTYLSARCQGCMPSLIDCFLLHATTSDDLLSTSSRWLSPTLTSASPGLGTVTIDSILMLARVPSVMGPPQLVLRGSAAMMPPYTCFALLGSPEASA
ncbi:hypothetical protein F4823DRAFT_188399 [Ustulina deusta]|nr:hypothetical protein F4823DRAFT_188399 [Ustulina deusta]